MGAVPYDYFCISGRRGAVPYDYFVFRDVEAPFPTIVKQLAAILTALAFHFGEGGPLAVEEVLRVLKIFLYLRLYV